jgi:predicted phage terminase large subunit-like protein
MTTCPALPLTPSTKRELLQRLRLNTYIPHFPHPKQLYALLLPHLEVFFGGSAGPGKALDIATPLPTPDGWICMGDIQVGQALFDEQGQICHVTHTYAIHDVLSSYRLTFDDDSTIDACADHQWLTFDARALHQLTTRTPAWRAQRRAHRASHAGAGRTGKGAGRGHAAKPWLAERNRQRPPASLPLPTGTLRTTDAIYKTLRTGHSQRANHAIPVGHSLQLPSQDLPIDPYCLGAWLGDGSHQNGVFTGEDAEIWQAFVQAGYAVSHHPTSPMAHYVSGLLPGLRQLGVWKSKHIPLCYLRASPAQRLALLQGLMDTDGHVTSTGDVEFTNTNPRLAQGVYELITSLGWKVRLAEGRATWYGRDCGAKYRLNWMPSEYVFRLTRKRERQALATRRTTRFRYIVACDPIAPTLMRCISVDSPSHLYLAGPQMVPTHNSDWLLMSALQYVDMPDYSAILFRRTFAELSKPEALMERAHSWLRHTDAHWNGQTHTYTFPSGAHLVFSHLEHEGSMYEHQSAAYQFIGCDELTTFTERMYRFLFSRLRRLAGSTLPLRMRSASNPGGIGHQWVRQRFMVEQDPARAFVPARQSDNPSLDVAAYDLSLAQLDPVTRQRLRHGDWDVAEEGKLFQRHWFRIVQEWPKQARCVRFWDFAGTEEERVRRGQTSNDPDYTVGLRVGEWEGRYYVIDMRRDRLSPKGVEELVLQTAHLDGRAVDIWMEQEPGSSGLKVIDDYQRRVLKGFAVSPHPSTGSKIERAKPASSAAEAGNICLLEGPWNRAFLDEVPLFGNPGVHDDIVDALSGAHYALTSKKPVQMW